MHRREADSPNAIWQADHIPVDILLVRADGEAAKPWLTTVIDDYSRAGAGYFLSFEGPSALQALSATAGDLAQGRSTLDRVRHPRCSVHRQWSDFTCQHLEQVGAALKIRLVFSIPGKPGGRGRIERYFST